MSRIVSSLAVSTMAKMQTGVFRRDPTISRAASWSATATTRAQETTG